MIKEKKYIFETKKDIKILNALKNLVGKTSTNDRIEHGISREDDDLCSEFYDAMCVEFPQT